MKDDIWYQITYFCCGDTWDISMKEVGPDKCVKCGGEVEPAWYAEDTDLIMDDNDFYELGWG